MKLNLHVLYFLAVATMFFVLKSWCSTMTNDQLYFLLKPTDVIVGSILDSPSVYSAESGFYHKHHGIIIERSCSGYNYWLLCFIMLSFQAYQSFSNKKVLITLLPVLLIAAYLLTIPVNSSRIILSIASQSAANYFLPIRPHLILHQIVGTFTYFFLLISTYFVVSYIFNKISHYYEQHSSSALVTIN